MHAALHALVRGTVEVRYLPNDLSSIVTYEGGTPFGIVLTGGNGCAQRLHCYPMLESRVSSWIEVRPLSDQQCSSCSRPNTPSTKTPNGTSWAKAE